mmetsp:Transcript_22067/g.30413  ORF Transcript_22067/g.30413 Transcript_22067/m.30413 type:complete len:117 (+) Transcript_22067:126-476(+)
MMLLNNLDNPELDVNTLKSTLGLVKQDTLFVRNFPYHYREDDLDDLFGDCGKIIDIRIPEDRVTRRSKGFAFIKMESEKAARKALKYDGHKIENRPLKVTFAEIKEEEENKDNQKE